MKGFFKVQTPDELYKKLVRFKPLSSEKVSVEESLHRILTEDIVSTVNLPEFPRSTVDGFAVKAKDTYGASEKNPALIQVVGEIPMGQLSDLEIHDGEAMKVATGGMVPRGADSVEMVEYTEWPGLERPRSWFFESPGSGSFRQGMKSSRLREPQTLERSGISIVTRSPPW